MPVNETTLQIKINSLVGLQKSLEIKIEKVAKTTESLKSIRRRNDTNPTDTITNQEMTDSRRDEIYEKCIPVADELLGVT